MSRSLLSFGLPKDIFTALTLNGYETLQDLVSVDAPTLAQDIKIPLGDAASLIARVQHSSSQRVHRQSVATMVRKSEKMSTKCAGLDGILEGGLAKGQILEISGPPGSPKHKLAMNIVLSFAETGDEIIFIDCQNNTNRALLTEYLSKSSNSTLDFKHSVHYSEIQTLTDLVLFVQRIPKHLESHPKVTLLVINSISFPFQQRNLTMVEKTAQMERAKQLLSKVVASHNLTIVTTSQMATKIVKEDGSLGTFDSGGKGILMPQLGMGYLPGGRSHRVAVNVDGLDSGFVELLSSPKYPPGKSLRLEPYFIVNGVIR